MEAAGGVRPIFDPNISPVDVKIRMMTFVLGDRGDCIHELN